MYKTTVAAAAVFLTGVEVCLAQPAGITPEMINRSLPVEGAFGSHGHTVPLMGWGNGGEFANVASNWLTIKGDKKEEKMLTDKNCSLCTNSNRYVRSKGIK